jgi:hypothetical protein
MSDDWVTRLRRLVGQINDPPPAESTADFREIDQRLGQVEQSLSDIVIRLRLLERQADPRGIREQQHDG